MVATSARHDATVITVCKYDTYQKVSLPSIAETETSNATPTRHQRDKLENIKTIETDSEAYASGAEAPDHRKRLFNEGLKKLATMTGKGPDACRSFVGKCLKAASDDAITVLGLIEDAERNQVVDPSAWIASRLKQSTGPPRQLTEFQRGRNETKDILNDLENFATGSSGRGQENPRLLSGNSGERSEGLRGGTGGDIIDLPAGGYRSSG
jgi:hypothetical protein